MKIVAVIPVRSGSQRIQNKNLRRFCNTTLLELKIQNLLRVPELDSIIVNTDSPEAINIVERWSPFAGGGKLSFHKRESYYCSSQCSGSEFFCHIGKVTDTDLFVYTPCTSPFIKPETISQCIRAYMEHNRKYDCVSTVSIVKEFLWLNGRPINYDPFNAPNSQDLPNIVALNFGATVVSRDDLICNRNIIGKHPYFLPLSDIESVDIDTPLDFFVAESLYQRLYIEDRDLLE